MEYIYIGKIVNTHGIKGELKILSDFKDKSKVFTKNMKIYLGNDKDEKTINSYRHHKDFDMVILQNINDINEALKYKNIKVYINKDDIDVPYFYEDLIGLNVYMNKLIGTVTKIRKGIKYDYICVGNVLIPNIPEFIDNIDVKNNRIEVKSWEGLIDEN